MFGLDTHIMAVIVVAVFAFITLFLDAVARRIRKANLVAGLIALIGIVAGGILFVYSETISGELLIFDSSIRYLSLLVMSLVVLLLISAIVYTENCDCEFPLFSLLMFSSLGIILIAMSNNLVVLYLSWELMSIPSYALVALNYRVREGAEAAFKYFVYGAISSALILYGISLIFGASGTISIVELSKMDLSSNPIGIWGEIFVIAGIGIKIGIIPLHMWIPDTYDGAPTLIAGYLSAVTKIGAVIALYKIFDVALLSLRSSLIWLIAIFAAITMTFGNIFALGQKNIVRMLAYSSIAHAGYIISIFAVAPESSFSILLLYLTVFSIADLGIFLGAWIYRYYLNAVYLDDFNEISKGAGYLAFAAMIYLLSLTGIPPLSGFAGKFVIFMGLLGSGYLWLAILLAINSAISLGYYGRLIKRMYLDEAKASIEKKSIPKLLFVPITLTLILTIVLGLYPQIIFVLA